LYPFDLTKAQKRLLASPLIQAAKITKNFPNTLYIEYETREPIAFLDDFTNTAVDIHGFLFPFKPFFTPKKLPKITVGMTEFGESKSRPGSESGSWGEPLKGYRAEIAFKIYKLLMQYGYADTANIIKIDTSKAFALSYGQREIVVVLEENLPVMNEKEPAVAACRRMLRLSTGGYPQELSNYLILRKELLKLSKKGKTSGSDNTTVIDLRLPHLAFIYG
jgi:hypothetical protein